MKPFRIAYQKKLDADNRIAWVQGMYIKAAITSALNGKKSKYPDAPFGTEEEAKEATKESAEIASKRFDAWTKIFNERFENQEA